MGIDLTAAIKNTRSGSYASADNKESGALAESPRCAPRKHSHYFKDVSGLGTVDVYRVLLLFGVTDPCLQHAIKKLLVAGGRGGGKDISRDVREARETLERWEEMRREEQAGAESQAASEQIASLIEKSAATQGGSASSIPAVSFGTLPTDDQIASLIKMGAATQAQALRPLSKESNPRPGEDGNSGVCAAEVAGSMYGCILDRGHPGLHRCAVDLIDEGIAQTVGATPLVPRPVCAVVIPGGNGYSCILDRGHKGAHSAELCKGFVGRAQLCSQPLKHEGACR